MGRMSVDDLKASISPDDPHYPRTRLIALENSYGKRQGAPVPVDYFKQIRSLADRYDLGIHLDGARLFNAAAALGVQATEITSHVDSVSFCLSKGLCAPVGSVVCGSAEFIDQARRIRKALGGGMRQAGVIASAGIVALEEMVDRLADDHANAKRLAYGLSEIPGIQLEPEEVKTNIVFFDLSDDVPHSAEKVVARLRDEGKVLLGVSGERTFRAVTHYWVGAAEVDILLSRLPKAMRR
jgi:threonine aldolase